MGYDDLDVEGQSEFLKLTAGAPVTIHLLTKDPKKEIVHWVENKKSTCLVHNCDICASGNKARKRWSADVWDRKDQSVKKLEFGPKISGQIKEIATMLKEGGKTIHDTDLRIKTTGSGMETDYSVLPVPALGEIPAETLEKYGHVPF